MAYKVAKTKKESLEQLKLLVAAFEKEHDALKSSKYSEAQLRNDFINPLLKTFGWDVENESAQSQFLRTIIQEESIDVDEDNLIAKKNPDYTLRILGSRKLFIEAKKVSFDIEKSAKAAFQTRRYGWNANLGISILTNFEKLIVYDCRHKPSIKDEYSVARYKTFSYSDFLTEFDPLYDLLSYPSIASGFIDDYFSLTQNDLSTFDDEFLKQIEIWRLRLAIDIIRHNTGFNEESINFLVQRLLNRIVFLRICEDREIEKYETLRAIKNYDNLKALFVKSDEKYNSGLFNFIEDIFSLKIKLNSAILIEIFNELYYPESPYDFSVVDPTILSQIYERYLGSKISIVETDQISIVEEPEVAISSGVVPTPKLIVENIVKETLTPLFTQKNLAQIQQLKIADICCGSGTFLISVYDYLLQKITLAFIAENITDDELIYRSFDGSYILTLKAKHAFLLNNIYGVDINPYAVEVTKFSLLLKLLENENSNSTENFLTKYGQKVLPDLNSNIKTGNSLVDEKYFEFDHAAIQNNELLYKVKPFTWKDEFPFLERYGGFDAIIGNPPYVRIQNMVKYVAEEVKYYQHKISGFTVAKKDTFDKYYLFIQRAIQLLNEGGILGYIIPNKFFIVKGGKSLRKFIVDNSSLFKIIHFGVQQVFPDRSTYTAVLILDKQSREKFYFKRIKKIVSEFIAGSMIYIDYNSGNFTENPWIFISKETEEVFNKIKANNTTLLKDISEITVGLQTSKNEVYIIKPEAETAVTFQVTVEGKLYEIEKEICKPCLFKYSFDLFDTVQPNAQLIFPYQISDNKATVFSVDYFENNYPLALAYLTDFKELLLKRSINGKNPIWYQFGRTQSLTEFQDTSKLIWHVLSTKPTYVYDSNNLLITGGGNGPYYSLLGRSSYSLLYIMGILSHPIFEAMVKAGASEFRGAYYSHGKQFIENLPIKTIDFESEDQVKVHDEISETVRQLIETKQEYNQQYQDSKKDVLVRKMIILNDTLISQVNNLYGLTMEDISLVTNDEMLLTDLNEE